MLSAQAEPADHRDQREGDGSDAEGEGEPGFGGQWRNARRQVLEQLENNILLRPLTQYTGPAARPYVPIEAR